MVWYGVVWCGVMCMSMTDHIPSTPVSIRIKSLHTPLHHPFSYPSNPSHHIPPTPPSHTFHTLTLTLTLNLSQPCNTFHTLTPTPTLTLTLTLTPSPSLAAASAMRDVMYWGVPLSVSVGSVAAAKGNASLGSPLPAVAYAQPLTGEGER